MIAFVGAAERIRTSDPRITNALLYRLSYRGALELDPEKWEPVFRKDHAPQNP
jgi:hypothetical protein